jgi:DNA polymerase-3 subunit delta'
MNTTTKDKKKKSTKDSTFVLDFEAHPKMVLALHESLKNESSGIARFIQTMTPTLITGYQGLPILEVAKFMAKAKLCNGPCLGCLTCQSVDKESSIHLKVVRPEGRLIKVDQVREVIDFLSFKRDHVTIVIFDQAHLMNLQAANALLKTLEEPPENCWLLLTSPSLKNMLSTIRSRCLVYKSRPLNEALVTQALGLSLNESSGENLSSPLESDYRSNKTNLLQGRWDWILKSEEVLGSLQDVENWLQKFSSQADHLELMDWMKGKEGLQEFLVYLRLLLKAKALEQKPYQWVRLMDQVQKCESALNSNVDTKLVEDLLFKALKDSYVLH